ncbi:cancer/testis antigen family 45 member A1-like [Macaca nemestrina]|uniref:cancer/testis antigen family 45 member A1-like n=1 Tax=Macaca nemestrina TaxID=9545 RepID=UPI0039B8984E
MRKPGSNAPVGGIITSKFFGDDLKVTEILPFSKIQKDINAEIKEHEKIFKYLEGLQAPIEVKGQYFESIIKEAVSYIRRDIILHLEKKLKRMI